MKKPSLIYLVLVVMCFGLVHCESKTNEKVIEVPQGVGEVDDKDQGDSGNRVRSEKLVNSAEELMSPIGFMVADQILDLALKADPKNRKAQFYKHVTTPLMRFRGILTRISPLTSVFSKLHRELSLANGALGEFLRDRSGGEPFRNEEDMQKFVAQLEDDYKNLADFISRNKNMITRLSVAHIYDFNKLYRNCSVYKLSKTSYRIVPCPFMQQIKLRVNRGDWEVFYQMANGARMAIAAGVSYEGEGLIDLFKRDQNRELKVPQIQVQAIQSHARLGRLRSDHHLEVIRERSVETYTGLRWLVEYQPSLCNRQALRSEHAFDRICLDGPVRVGPAEIRVANALDLLRMSISGHGGATKAVKPFRGYQADPSSSEKKEDLHVDMLALVKFPVEDLKTLLPTDFDKCGHPKSVPDASYGGTFPKADGPDFFLRQRDCWEEKFGVNP